jgi:hypothetical protein
MNEDGTLGVLGGVLAEDLEADAVLIREQRVEIGEQDPATMKLSDIRAELKSLPLPGEVITKARQNMDAVNAAAEEQREELRILQGDAQARYVEATEMAERIRIRRRKLAEAASAAEKQQSSKQQSSK